MQRLEDYRLRGTVTSAQPVLDAALWARAREIAAEHRARQREEKNARPKPLVGEMRLPADARATSTVKVREGTWRLPDGRIISVGFGACAAFMRDRIMRAKEATYGISSREVR